VPGRPVARWHLCWGISGNTAALFITGLAFGGIAVLIFFIHHIASVAQETNTSIDRLFPEKREPGTGEAEGEENERLLASLDERTWYAVSAEVSGY